MLHRSLSMPRSMQIRAISSLRGLTSLTLSIPDGTPRLLHSLSALTALTSFTLEVGSGPSLACLAVATGLSDALAVCCAEGCAEGC